LPLVFRHGAYGPRTLLLYPKSLDLQMRLLFLLRQSRQMYI
jgi:hypothetical protein